jgi:two-component sensor histidine kinase
VKRSLLQEIHHRVKNNLQVISSLLNLQSNYVKDHQTLEVIRESINRIRSMSLIHQSLYQQKDFVRSDFAKYVQELAHNLIETYQNESCTVELIIEVEKMRLSLDDSVPCGLILNELISNALKYAFADRNEGSVTVRMEQHSDYCVLEVRDDGIGFPENFAPEEVESLGIELVHTLTEQLDGELTMENKDGAYVRVSWPLVEEKIEENLQAPAIV